MADSFIYKAKHLTNTKILNEFQNEIKKQFR